MSADDDARADGRDRPEEARERPLPPPTGLDRAVDAGPAYMPPATRERVPYHRLSPEERREQWRRLREAQSKRARAHWRAPVIFFGLGVLAWVLGWWLLHIGHGAYASLSLWGGVGFAGFGIIALARNVMGGLAGKKDDLTPPGF